MEADFFIVGQGLAGSLLTFELLNRGKTVLVFDDPVQCKASLVAAGIVNPIVFRRMTKSWMVDEAFPAMEDTFQKIEKLLKLDLYFPASILKILSEDLAENWKRKTFANKLLPFVEEELIQNQNFKNIKNNFGFGLVSKAGKFDTSGFISDFKAYLQANNLLVTEKLEHSELLLNPDCVSYKNLKATQIIFCEGHAASANPYFQNLLFKHSKGEVLEVEIPGLDVKEIISDGIFVMPLGNNRYKVGATYSWNQPDNLPTVSGRDELIVKLKELVTSPITVIAHHAGIRPTMHDRKPVVGIHPKFNQIGIFNGLGPKGVLLAPYFAQMFADYLTGNSNGILTEVNISRYFN